MFWTEERVDVATKLWVSGKSLVDIANALGGGATKNSVAGKIDRLGLMNHKDRPQKPGRIGFKPKSDVPRKPRNPPATKVVKLKVEPRVKEISVDTSKFDARNPFYPSENYVLLMDLGMGTCRWPFDGPRHLGTVYCGDPTMEGSSYCESHRCMSVNRSPRSLKKAA